MLSLSNQSAGSVHLSVERALERALERKPLSPAKGAEQIAESIEFRDALDSHTGICKHSTVALSDTSWVCLLLCNSAAPQLELQLRGLGKPNGMSVLSLRRRNIQPYTEIVYI